MACCARHCSSKEGIQVSPAAVLPRSHHAVSGGFERCDGPRGQGATGPHESGCGAFATQRRLPPHSGTVVAPAHVDESATRAGHRNYEACEVRRRLGGGAPHVTVHSTVRHLPMLDGTRWQLMDSAASAGTRDHLERLGTTTPAGNSLTRGLIPQRQYPSLLARAAPNYCRTAHGARQSP